MVNILWNYIIFMGGLDHFLAQSLESTIRENLGKQTTHKIEKRLFEKHGISLAESVKQFHKLDLVLREHFGKGADGIEENFFKNLCSINLKRTKNKKETETDSENWVTIKESSLTDTILDAFGDSDKKRILASVTNKPKIIYDILKESKIPQTSGYRKINALIEKGLLIIEGTIDTHDGKKVNKYRSILQDVRINIIKNEVVINVQLSKQNMENSSLLLAMSDL